MRNIFLSALFLCVSVIAFGQKSTTKNLDIIYLKSGGFMKGEVLAKGSFGVKFRMLGANEIELPGHIVKKIIEEDPTYLYFDNGSRLKFDGKYFGVRLSSAHNIDGLSGLHSQFSYGKYLSPKLSIGLGTGFDFQAGPGWRNYYFVPVFAELIYRPFNKKVNPYLKMASGFNIPIQIGWEWQGKSNKFSGGVLVQPSVGLEFASKARSTFFLELGYKFQTTKANFIDRFWGWEENTETVDKIVFKRIEFAIGMRF